MSLELGRAVKVHGAVQAGKLGPTTNNAGVSAFGPAFRRAARTAAAAAIARCPHDGRVEFLHRLKKG